jgi:hypothetical protein
MDQILIENELNIFVIDTFLADILIVNIPHNTLAEITVVPSTYDTVP